MTGEDARWMKRALELAARGGARTRPNPLVGAVLVKSGRIVGSGWHRAAGRPHAELNAIRAAGAKAGGATLYVTLEPCAHVGRTPPCVDAVISAGVRRVVAAMIDPNPRMRGRGIRRLKAAGIRVTAGVLEPEARRLNRVFVTWMRLGRPFVTVKVAQSLDGKIATRSGDCRWISGPEARRWVHRLRAEADAILVGVRTVLADDPRLTVRPGVGRGGPNAPWKVVLDSSLRTPPRARLFASKTPVVIAASAAASRSRERRLRAAGAEVWRLPGKRGKVDLRALLTRLSAREIGHVLIEGGGEVIASALDAGAVDRIACVVSPLVIGGRAAVTAVEGEGAGRLADAMRLSGMEARRLGGDLLLTADVPARRRS